MTVAYFPAGGDSSGKDLVEDLVVVHYAMPHDQPPFLSGERFNREGVSREFAGYVCGVLKQLLRRKNVTRGSPSRALLFGCFCPLLLRRLHRDT